MGKGKKLKFFKPGVTTISNQVQVILDGTMIISLFYEHYLGIRRNIPIM